MADDDVEWQNGSFQELWRCGAGGFPPGAAAETYGVGNEELVEVGALPVAAG